MKKFFERVADALGTFSPIIILVLVCMAYLRTPQEKPETKAGHDKSDTRKEQPFNPLKQINAASLYGQTQFPIHINTVNN